MSTFVLIPGAGGTAWYWHRTVPLLQRAGHEAIAVDLPGDDPTAGLPEYTRLVTDAIGGRDDVVLVAQSLGAFTAPLVAAKIPLRSLVFVNAMIPAPGETPGAWWDNTGWLAGPHGRGRTGRLRHGIRPGRLLPARRAARGRGRRRAHQRPEADVVFGSVCDFGAWPAVPIRAVAGAEDRFFPAAFQRGLAAGPARHRGGRAAGWSPDRPVTARARSRPTCSRVEEVS